MGGEGQEKIKLSALSARPTGTGRIDRTRNIYLLMRIGRSVEGVVERGWKRNMVGR